MKRDGPGEKRMASRVNKSDIEMTLVNLDAFDHFDCVHQNHLCSCQFLAFLAPRLMKIYSYRSAMTSMVMVEPKNPSGRPTCLPRGAIRQTAASNIIA